MYTEKVFSRKIYSLELFELFFPLIELSPQVYKFGFLFSNGTHYSTFNHYIVISAINPRGWEKKDILDKIVAWMKDLLWNKSWWIIEIKMNTLSMENEISEHCDQKEAWGN